MKSTNIVSHLLKQGEGIPQNSLRNGSHVVYFPEDRLGYQIPATSAITKLNHEKKKVLYLRLKNNYKVKFDRMISGIDYIGYIGFVNEDVAPPPAVVIMRNMDTFAANHFFFSSDSTEQISQQIMLPTVLLSAPIPCAYYEKINGKIDKREISFYTVDGSPANLSGIFIFEIHLGREL